MHNRGGIEKKKKEDVPTSNDGNGLPGAKVLKRVRKGVAMLAISASRARPTRKGNPYRYRKKHRVSKEVYSSERLYECD